MSLGRETMERKYSLACAQLSPGCPPCTSRKYSACMYFTKVFTCSHLSDRAINLNQKNPWWYRLGQDWIGGLEGGGDIHLASLGYSWIHLVSLGLTWMYWISLCSLGLTWIHWTHLDSLDMETRKICTLRELHCLLCFSLILRVLAYLFSLSNDPGACTWLHKFSHPPANSLAIQHIVKVLTCTMRRRCRQ